MRANDGGGAEHEPPTPRRVGRTSDPATGGSANGTDVLMYDCNGGANQKWNVCR